MATTPRFPAGYLEADISGRLIAATASILVITTVLLILRTYVRMSVNTVKGWDDYLLFPAWLLLVALCALMFVSISAAGVGRHVEFVASQDPQKIVTLQKFVYMLDWFYVPVNTLARVSIVLLYLRVFTSRSARIFCWITLAFLAGICASDLIAAQVQCRPLSYTWDKNREGGGECFDVILWWRLANIPNIIADVAILLLPVRSIWNLKASLARKAGISLVCLTGSVGLIASTTRTIVFFVSDLEGDPTWHSVPTLLWTVVECGMYFSAACLISLRPLLARVPKWAKAHFTSPNTVSREHTYSFSERLRGSRGVMGRQVDKKRTQHDLDSFTNIVTIAGDAETGSLEPYDANHISAASSTEDPGKIHVRTEVEVDFHEGGGKPMRSYDFS